MLRQILLLVICENVIRFVTRPHLLLGGSQVMNSEEELAVDILRELDEVSASKVLMGMQPECAGQLAMKIDAEMMGGRFRHMSPEKIGIVVVEMDPDKAW